MYTICHALNKEKITCVPYISVGSRLALPNGLLQAVEPLDDGLVIKAPQLIYNKITNIIFMSIHCKMDGGKFFNWVQSGLF